MNREERYTTVTLTINGESAKKTLEELSRKAEELGEKIRLIQGRGTRDEGRGTRVRLRLLLGIRLRRFGGWRENWLGCWVRLRRLRVVRRV